MVTHEFICDRCRVSMEDTKTHERSCPKCGVLMRWNLNGIGIPDGDYYHESHSLAIHPDQIPEHRQEFPGIEVTSDGLPCFTSTKQQEKYAHACSHDKKAQRLRGLGRVTI